MTRVPRVDPEHLSGADAELYGLYTTGTRADPSSDFRLVDDAGQLIGPPASWMLNAELGLGLERLGREIRFNLALPPRWREIVILTVARVEDSPFERYAHERAGLKAGLSQQEIDALAHGTFTPVDETEDAIVELASVALSGAPVDESLWSRSTARLGDRGVFEVVTLVGYYRMMALQLRAFELFPPA